MSGPSSAQGSLNLGRRRPEFLTLPQILWRIQRCGSAVGSALGGAGAGEPVGVGADFDDVSAEEGPVRDHGAEAEAVKVFVQPE